MLVRLIKQIAKENTLTSLGVAGSRALIFILLIPLIAANLTENEFGVWLKLGIILQFVEIMHFGFMPTFSRYYAYGPEGLAKKIKGLREEGIENVTGALCRTHHTIYFYISLLAFPTASLYAYFLVGSQFFEDGSLTPYLFFIFCVSMTVQFYGRGLGSRIFGLNKIYILRWGEFAALLLFCMGIVYFSLARTLTLSKILWLTSWQSLLVGIWALFISEVEFRRNLPTKISSQFSWSLFRNVMENSTKTGIGNALIVGGVSLIVLFYEKYHDQSQTDFWLSFRIVNSIGNMAQYIFLVSIPMLTGLYIKKSYQNLKTLINHRIFYHLCVYCMLGILSYIWLNRVAITNAYFDFDLYLLFVITWYFYGLGSILLC